MDTCRMCQHTKTCPDAGFNKGCGSYKMNCGKATEDRDHSGQAEFALLGAERLAERFHKAYERLAPYHGYETREETAKEWDKVPENNRQLMIHVCAELLREGI